MFNNSGKTESNNENKNVYDYEENYDNGLSNIKDNAELPTLTTPESIIFKDLSEHDIMINLKFLGDVKKDEKIMIINGRFMQTDQRYLQCFVRRFTSDSRGTTLDFINHVVDSAKKLCLIIIEKIKYGKDRDHSFSKLLSIHSAFISAKTGLSRMSLTYQDDKLNSASINTIIDKIDVFCRETLKQVI